MEVGPGGKQIQLEDPESNPVDRAGNICFLVARSCLSSELCKMLRLSSSQFEHNR